MHKNADLVAGRTDLPLLNIGDAVGNAITGVGLSKVGLLGTKFVMEEHFYRDRLRKCFGIEVLVPPEEKQNVVDRIIYDDMPPDKVSRSCVRLEKRKGIKWQRRDILKNRSSR